MADARLSQLPAVNVLADGAAVHAAAPRWAVVEAARRAIAAARLAIQGGDATRVAIEPRDVARAADLLVRAPLRRVINATGVVLHTNLGRAPLPAAARAAIDDVAGGYSNLEYDLARGARGSRHDHLRDLLRELTGADDGIVANNNAAATVLGLAALAAGREVIVSRGELIEIGGSFRLPEILALSGAKLVEVGTTNKTHARDYERAITADTGLLLKVHRSNFAVVGFTAEVDAAELVAIGRARGVATMIDLGSGALVDRATQRAWGLTDEPTVRDAVASGADLVTFSGDKLLGGPQAGLAVGRTAAVEGARKHPLMRALRPDKLQLAALAATLALYRDGRALAEVPVLAALGAPADALRARADQLAAAVGATAGLVVAVEPCTSAVGGGAMPTAELASWAVTLAGRSADRVDDQLRAAAVPIVARVADGRVWLDVRTIAPAEVAEVAAAIRAL
jgi:L-seryl-tRNA(Ser) seleniumtransferase|nr:L-seryl-tRNA(Sec) selenium transferase [Kofleriaceae bacterium]